MAPRKIGSFAALLGGVVWLVTAVLEWGAEPNQALYLAGVALMLLALAAAGYALVATAPVWLRAVVASATPALGLMVWLIVFDAISAKHLALLGGGIALLLGAGLGLSRGRDEDTQPESRGSHAAR
jgi:hypothetical protein